MRFTITKTVNLNDADIAALDAIYEGHVSKADNQACKRLLQMKLIEFDGRGNMVITQIGHLFIRKIILERLI